ncbi:glycine betaine ABC transporter substrate-binding protein [Marinifilum caeruleilacunae]|uniref:Glycine/betaine ABC transporter n=1 Tax=Marinifilum caeruleilacunae TaxID=2499076 RepID=A0ABX1WW80_9BACT|nr:glycine betaine ABC transporter substrate-binding protein [Marinifilum caeruleilacunae]NOU60154.1 glycine/betaine ABC transporter [Marinifilum caeruleilacunae]
MRLRYNKLITIGVTDLSFHRVTASLLTNVLRSMGFEVNRVYSPHQDNFDKLRYGELDMLTSAWLPFSDGKYKAELEKDVSILELGLFYEPYSIWAVPDYVPEEEVSEIADLHKKNVAEKMRPAIQGVCPGAGISRSSVKIMNLYGLSKTGYRFFTGTEECCYTAMERAFANKEWVVVPLWKPNFLQHLYNIRELKDPKGLLGPVDRAVLLLREDRKHLFSEDQLRLLDSLRFSNEIISDLDYQVSIKNEELDTVTKRWLLAHNKLVLV